MSKKTQKELEAESIESMVLRGQDIPGKEKIEPFDFDSFEFKSISDFDIYNAQVRKHNRNCIHERNKMKVKVPNESFYKLYKTKFVRFEQRENILKVRVRNKKIDWQGQLKSGGTYMLPMPVIEFLNGLATPEFAEIKVEHGNAVHTETRQVGETPRFSCNVLEYAV
jgi:hypothetical protein